MTNPVMRALVAARMQEELQRAEALNADLEPPRSWPNEMKNRFKSLPNDVAVFIERHERRRDLEIRRCHNELAKARQQLKPYRTSI